MAAVKTHVEKTADYKRTLTATVAWMIHFTIQKPEGLFWPVDRTPGVTVVQVAHMNGLNPVMMARGPEGEIRQVPLAE